MKLGISKPLSGLKSPDLPESNILKLAGKPKSASARLGERFKIQTYDNPRTGTKSYRVFGIKRDGIRIRKNFADVVRAQAFQLELNIEFLARQTDTVLRATKLSASQVALAEVAFSKLEHEQDLLPAVNDWLRHGKQHSVA